MKVKAVLVFTVMTFLCGAVRCEAQVKRIQMHIAGYLCGN
jgi:hypothetical protein